MLEDSQRLQRAEAEIDRYISRRARERSKAADLAEMWITSERAYREKKQEALREEWAAWHEAQLVRHRALLEELIDHHRRAAQRHREAMA